MNEFLAMTAFLGLTQLVGFLLSIHVVKRHLRRHGSIGLRGGLMLLCSAIGWFGFCTTCLWAWELNRKDASVQDLQAVMQRYDRHKAILTGHLATLAIGALFAFGFKAGANPSHEPCSEDDDSPTK